MPSMYHPHMASLMRAPQHFIAGVLYVLLLLQLHKEPRFLSVSGILLATSLLWSPFVAIALLPPGHCFGSCERHTATHSVAKLALGDSYRWIAMYILAQWARYILALWLGVDSIYRRLAQAATRDTGDLLY